MSYWVLSEYLSRTDSQCIIGYVFFSSSFLSPIVSSDLLSLFLDTLNQRWHLSWNVFKLCLYSNYKLFTLTLSPPGLVIVEYDSVGKLKVWQAKPCSDNLWVLVTFVSYVGLLSSKIVLFIKIILGNSLKLLGCSLFHVKLHDSFFWVLFLCNF